VTGCGRPAIHSSLQISPCPQRVAARLRFRLTPITVSPVDRFPTETWATDDNFLP